jgi:hypothetical protein
MASGEAPGERIGGPARAAGALKSPPSPPPEAPSEEPPTEPQRRPSSKERKATSERLGRRKDSKEDAEGETPPLARTRFTDHTRCRYLFQADLGDPISCVYIGDAACMAGTMMGKAWLFNMVSADVEKTHGFSDEGLRSIYCDRQSTYLACSDICQEFRISKPHALVTTRYFSSYNTTGSLKSVLQNGPKVCIIFLNATVELDLTKGRSQKRPFKSSDLTHATGEVLPCDYDGVRLIVSYRVGDQSSPVYRVVTLERNEHTEIRNLPKADYVSLVKLWGAEYIACVVGRTVQLYDHLEQRSRLVFQGHRAEVLALGTQEVETITSLSADGVVKRWEGRTGVCLHSLKIPQASFWFGYPYCLCTHGSRVLISADEGVFLMELDDTVPDV